MVRYGSMAKMSDDEKAEYLRLMHKIVFGKLTPEKAWKEHLHRQRRQYISGTGNQPFYLKDWDVYKHDVLPILKVVFKKRGWHGAIIGGVAREGKSSHDLDIYIANGVDDGNYEIAKEVLTKALGREVEVWFHDRGSGAIVNEFMIGRLPDSVRPFPRFKLRMPYIKIR
jgi:hypothetical protein